MSLINRLLQITSSRVDAFLDSVEDPESAATALIAELKENHKLAARAEAKARSALKNEQARTDEMKGKVERMKNGAILALRHNDESLAREAIVEQIRAEEHLERHGETLARSEEALGKARAARYQVEQRLEELTLRYADALARQRNVRQQTSESSTAQHEARNILKKVARIETDIDENMGAPHPEQPELTLEERLRNLYVQDEISRRIAEIRRKQRKQAS